MSYAQLNLFGGTGFQPVRRALAPHRQDACATAVLEAGPRNLVVRPSAFIRHLLFVIRYLSRAGWRGSVKKKRVPWSRGLKPSRPPWASMRVRLTPRPSPLPPRFVVKNGSKIRSAASGAIPWPVSSQEMP